MIKKICTYTIYAIISLMVAYFMITKYGYNPSDSLERLYTYNRYIIYTTASIIIGASIRQEKNRYFKRTIGLLIIVHLIMLSKIIIYDQYQADIYMFIVSAVSIVTLYGVLHIPKALIRSMLILPVLAVMITSIMIATSPFKNTIHGRDDFYNQQKPELHIYISEPNLVLQEAQATITIKQNNAVQQVIPILEQVQTTTGIKINTEIQFGSNIPLYNSALFIQSPEGEIYNIHSQSIAHITLNSGGLAVENTGILYTEDMSQLIEQYTAKLQRDYQQKKATYLESITKNKLRNNKYIHYIGGQIISYLGKRNTYMHRYMQNMQQREIMRNQAGLQTNLNTSGSVLIMPDRTVQKIREYITNPH